MYATLFSLRIVPVRESDFEAAPTPTMNHLRHEHYVHETSLPFQRYRHSKPDDAAQIYDRYGISAKYMGFQADRHFHASPIRVSLLGSYVEKAIPSGTFFHCLLSLSSRVSSHSTQALLIISACLSLRGLIKL